MTIAAQLIRILLQVVSVVVLARLLLPEDYGLLAMVLAIIGVGEIFRDFGLSSAAIQAETLTTRQRDNLFWMNTGIGLVLAATLFLVAPAVAAVFDQTELISISHVLSAVFVLNGLATQFRASLVRGLRFRALAAADIISPATGLIAAVSAALLGFSYWSLVIQQIAQGTALLIVLMINARWLPGLPRRGESMGRFVRFGWNLVSAQLVGYVSNNIDTLLIGVRFGAGPLGIYNRGFQLLMTPLSQIRSPLTTVALPVLSRLKDESARFNDFVARGQLALGYTLVAGLGVIISGAEPITAILLGDRWAEVAPILRFLAIAEIFQTLAFVGYWVYLSRGLTGTLFRYTLISASIKVVCILIGSTGGILGIAIGYAIAPAISWPLSFWWLSRHTQVPTRRLYSGAGRILAVVGVSATISGGVALPLSPFGPLVQLLGLLLASASSYAILVTCVPPLRRDVLEVLQLVRLLRRKAPRDGAA